MKYIWLVAVFIGIAGIFLGFQRYQVDHTEAFGMYPCFLCSAVEPEVEVTVFSAVDCPSCDLAVQRVLRLCRLTGIQYGGTYYDGSQEAGENLQKLGLEKKTDFLVVVSYRGAVIGTSTSTDRVEEYLSDTAKEVAHL
ncbi:MAG: hypothetical protein HXS41_05350 [Theionarchaea archaeon]|nr:hypothetical protein [Theionarchaea archaeon]MBU7001817.1 hypothetical protein [Theionarchaea archaeon]MBU7020462.1 hypothetical protein [Theionarchaea archaeon]MBU7035679.1 hypothetical protein [Theionarchaea archaeon]MBU7041084.1 hypothetical protein [Theionarchaea archaeon]